MKIKIAFPDTETADAVCRKFKPIGWEGIGRPHRFFDYIDPRDSGGFPYDVIPTHSAESYFHQATDVTEVGYEDLCAAVQNRLSISEVIDRAIARRRSER